MAQDQTPNDGSVSDINVINEYYSEQYITLDDDTEVTRSIINGPSTLHLDKTSGSTPMICSLRESSQISHHMTGFSAVRLYRLP